MPTIRRRTVIAAGEGPTTVFPLQGNQYEYLPFNARVEFAIVGNAALSDGSGPGTSADIDKVTATVFSGSDILQQQSGITNKTQTTAQSKDAVYPDDFLLDDVAAAGERLSVQLDIPDPTALNDTIIDTVVKITPL